MDIRRKAKEREGEKNLIIIFRVRERERIS
jgi:hypothetical protein